MNSQNPNKTDNINNNNISNNESDIEKYNFDDFVETEKEYIILSKLKNDKQANTCTYKRGYIEQELIFCSTCYDEKKQASALCVGCAFTCHDTHELINLGFRRKFKCDCGNSKYCN